MSPGANIEFPKGIILILNFVCFFFLGGGGGGGGMKVYMKLSHLLVLLKRFRIIEILGLIVKFSCQFKVSRK